MMKTLITLGAMLFTFGALWFYVAWNSKDFYQRQFSDLFPAAVIVSVGVGLLTQGILKACTRPGGKAD